MAARNGVKHEEGSAACDRSGEASRNPTKSSSPIPSPGSDDNGRRGRSRTRVHNTPRVDDAVKRR